MVKSMTGYGRAESASEGRSLTVEVRAVNNRYLDCSVRMPRAYLFAEEEVKARVQTRVARGKVDVFVTLEGSAAEGVQVKVNHPLADSYHSALRELSRAYGLTEEIPLSLLARFPEVLTTEKNQENVEQAAREILSTLEGALDGFDEMRIREGGRLAQDILARADAIQALLEEIETRAPQSVADYRARLEGRMAEVLSNTQLEPARILTEAALFADRVAVDEETVRLRSHLSQLRQMLAEGGATGRKLEFLIQEFNREANTIGSKCADLTVSRLVVDMKAEIEKIREQVQNVE